MVRIPNCSNTCCSGFPCTSSNNLLKEVAISFSLCISNLYPNFFAYAAKAFSFSSSGVSCMRYGKGIGSLLLFILETYSATVLFASNMNSSISLCASLLSLITIPIGFPFSSSWNFTSCEEKLIAPLSNLSFLNFCARSFNNKMGL